MLGGPFSERQFVYGISLLFRSRFLASLCALLVCGQVALNAAGTVTIHAVNNSGSTKWTKFNLNGGGLGAGWSGQSGNFAIGASVEFTFGYGGINTGDILRGFMGTASDATTILACPGDPATFTAGTIFPTNYYYYVTVPVTNWQYDLRINNWHGFAKQYQIWTNGVKAALIFVSPGGNYTYNVTTSTKYQIDVVEAPAGGNAVQYIGDGMYADLPLYITFIPTSDPGWYQGSGSIVDKNDSPTAMPPVQSLIDWNAGTVDTNPASQNTLKKGFEALTAQNQSAFNKLYVELRTQQEITKDDIVQAQAFGLTSSNQVGSLLVNLGGHGVGASNQANAFGAQDLAIGQNSSNSLAGISSLLGAIKTNTASFLTNNNSGTNQGVADLAQLEGDSAGRAGASNKYGAFASQAGIDTSSTESDLDGVATNLTGVNFAIVATEPTLTATLALPGGGSMVIDANPMHDTMISNCAGWIRALAAWASALALVFYVVGVTREGIQSMGGWSQVKGTNISILGFATTWVGAVIVYGIILVALLAVPALFLSWKSNQLSGAYAVLMSSPYTSGLTYINAAIWLMDQFFPLATVLGHTMLGLGYEVLFTKVMFAKQTVVRAMPS